MEFIQKRREWQWYKDGQLPIHLQHFTHFWDWRDTIGNLFQNLPVVQISSTSLQPNRRMNFAGHPDTNSNLKI